MRGTTLLQHTVDQAKASRAREVSVVLGSGAGEIQNKLHAEHVSIISNPKWNEGMSTSIRAGIASLSDSVDAAILSLCDQPFLTSGIFDSLIETFSSSGKSIVTCEYGGQIGPPVLFANTHFPKLYALKGDTGAKKIVSEHEYLVARVSFPLGSIDLDTPEDYKKFIQKEFGM